MYIQETYVDETRNGIYGETEPYECYTDDTGRLFRDLRRDYGRCRGKVYIDTDDGSKAIGWVFEKRCKYEDSPEYYKRIVWVTLHEREPEHSTKVFYKYI